MFTPRDNAVIQVRGLVAGFGGKIVLDGIDLDVVAGEIFFILGGSGSGKSTLLKHLFGLYTPMAGSISILGDELVGAQDAAQKRIQGNIGVMYQSGALFGSMSLLENVCLPLEEFTALPKAARERIARLKLSLVGLAGSEHKFPAELSGGMIKRAAIARAMALDPAVVFLDEPSAGLDPVTSAELDELILKLKRSLGITFVIVSHELASIFAIADTVVMLDAETHTIVAQGPPKELAQHSDSPLVRRFFNREVVPA